MSVRILADDLSGALDTAVMFAGEGGATVTWGPVVGRDSLAHCLNTRALQEKAAAKAMAKAAPWLADGHIAFKKCDSRLRGHVAAELAAMIAATPIRRVVVAPSYPAQGRFVVDGRVVTHSARGCVHEPVDLLTDLAAAGVKAHRARPGAPLADGVTLADARTDSDLDQIVAAGLSMDGPILWCGAAGLAAALARRLGTPAPRPARPKGPCLVAIGTNHPATQHQVSALRAATHLSRPLSIVSAPEAGDGGSPSYQGVGKDLQGGKHVLVILSPTKPSPPEAARAMVRERIARLATLAPPPPALVVTGGATLRTLVDAVHASAIALHGVFDDGVPVGRIVGGRWNGTTLVSKSGGFGNADLLVSVLNAADRF
ncbi:MAG: four-carbon acid sugar kinase family protein [Pseudomonadota bacterium]